MSSLSKRRKDCAMRSLSNRRKDLEELLKMSIQSGWSVTVKSLEADIEELKRLEEIENCT